MKTNRHLFRRIAGGLTALATALVMLPASAMAVDTSGYTTPQYVGTSDGVTIESSISGMWDIEANIKIIIDENVNTDEVSINLTENLPEIWVLPSSNVVVNVSIENNSDTPYVYKENSLAFGSAQYQPSVDEAVTGTVGAFDGYKIYLGSRNNFGRSYNHALDALCEPSLVEQYDHDFKTILSDEVIGGALIKKGYANGIYDLDEYYLDYYNEHYDPDITDLQYADHDYLCDLFSCYNAGGPGGLQHTDTKNLESNPEVAALMYYFLYDHILTVDDDTVASYMEKGSDTYNQMQSKIKSLVENGSGFSMGIKIDGPTTTNVFQNRSFN